jgi:predicted type IV restriction endonuclease
MKKTLKITAILLLAVTATFAQSKKEEVEFYQSLFGMEKKSVVTNFIQLEGEAYDRFWILYDDYEAERKVNGQKRIEILTKYTEAYLDLDDETTDALVVEAMKVRDTQSKLIKKYYKRMKKASGVKAAAQFYQLENYFANAINVVLTEQIPFIGEFDW